MLGASCLTQWKESLHDMYFCKPISRWLTYIYRLELVGVYSTTKWDMLSGINDETQRGLSLCQNINVDEFPHWKHSDDVQKGEIIGHFRVLLCLCFKTSLSANPFIWKWVLHAVSLFCNSTEAESELENDLFTNSESEYFQSRLYWISWV